MRFSLSQFLTLSVHSCGIRYGSGCVYATVQLRRADGVTSSRTARAWRSGDQLISLHALLSILHNFRVRAVCSDLREEEPAREQGATIGLPAVLRLDCYL